MPQYKVCRLPELFSGCFGCTLLVSEEVVMLLAEEVAYCRLVVGCRLSARVVVGCWLLVG